MTSQYQLAEQFAQAKGLALKNYLLNCIQDGNWESIHVEFQNEDLFQEVMDALGPDPEFASMCLVLVWAQMQHSAVLGGLPDKDASLIFVRCCTYAHNLKTSEELMELHLQYMRELALAVKAQRDTLEDSIPIVMCQRYIQEHLYDTLSPTALAEQFHFNQEYFSRLFKKKTNLSLAEYIRQQKLEEARKLLTFSSLSISEISSNLNFSNQSHFTTLFKKAFGCTPKQYRIESRTLKEN